MPVSVKLIVGKKTLRKSFAAGATVADAASEAGLNSETFISMLNGEVAHPKERLRNGDELELVRIIYGG
ncbi:MoaD/ThiS family protein [Candidatus Micrarchaeota archaeon]|nr:MoaD/ThiS family protein [Candidatus Micrarchaeota archaeon]